VQIAAEQIRPLPIGEAGDYVLVVFDFLDPVFALQFGHRRRGDGLGEPLVTGL
jgi:hypothetical protein